ncbi:hypothetical protein BDV96DRAFT_158224 [Lophiotrema nucula]|uniref:DUF6594 domain-containing protein n=1 Tax=Lophiotrema nucula TaxID=690887 RepID=A0A6A5Z0C4_9PLEO|nr:hypothetical protein BDV96DRAFT_158224 [Lophiotrema nucula]
MSQAPRGFRFATGPPPLSHLTAHSRNFVDTPEKIEHRRQGYPRLAAFINSDRDFIVFRRFGHLHVRFLLQLQDELAEIEQRLHELDNDEAYSFNLNSRRRDSNQDRTALLAGLGEKLASYDLCLEAYYKQIERAPSDSRNVQSVANWMKGNKPLVPEESAFLCNWEDLVSPGKQADHGGLDILVGRIAETLCEWGLLKVNPSRSKDKHVITVDASLIIRISRAITTSLAILTLTVPISILYKVRNMSSRLWIIGISTAVFSSCLCLFTHSRNYEIFSATAAYCAVLVVFVGNIQ